MSPFLRRSLLAAVASLLLASPALAVNAPSNLVATAQADARVQLIWTNNATDNTGFAFERSVAADFSSIDLSFSLAAPTLTSYLDSASGATTYYYRIKATGSPDSAWSNAAYTTTPPVRLAPVAPSDTTINVAWNANGSNTHISGYTYRYSTDSGFPSGTPYVFVSGASTASATVTAVTAATTYWFAIKAEGAQSDNSFDSPFGNAVAATTMPGSVTVTSTSNTTAAVTWSGNASNPKICGYRVAYASNAALTAATLINVSGGGATSATIDNMHPGETYYVGVMAVGTNGATQYDSPYRIVTITMPSAAPARPTGLAASPATPRRVNLSWTNNGGSAAYGFALKRTRADNNEIVWISGITGATSYADMTVEPGKQYTYVVRVENPVQDSAYSDPATATVAAATNVPIAPSSLNATPVAATQVNLDWSDNSSNETDFEITRSTDPNFAQPETIAVFSGIQGNTFTNTALDPSTTYYYRVRAEGATGNSGYATATATTPAAVANAIPTRFYGINAWMPYEDGAHREYGKLTAAWPLVQASGAQIARYGGNKADLYADPCWTDPNDADKGTFATFKQILTMVDTMRGRGIEPIIQVPVYNNRYNAAQAAELVRYINETNGRNVQYWSIGNEPNLASGVYHNMTAADIAAYIKRYAYAMKQVDNDIKILAPESTNLFDWTLIDALTNCTGLAVPPVDPNDVSGTDITGVDANGNPYVDIFTVHIYPFNGQQSTADVVAWPMQTGGFNDGLTQLKSKLANCSSHWGRTGAGAIQVAITEANIEWAQDSVNYANNGAASFIAGQFWAELLGIAAKQNLAFITFWSATEGPSASNLGLGYLTSDAATRRPTYYHFQMLAQNMRGAPLQTNSNLAKVKVFSAKDSDQITVLLMNQESLPYNYTLRLDNAGFDTSNAALLRAEAGVAAESTGTLAAESTTLLVFNTSGVFKKKVEYKKGDSAPAVTVY